jgi:hypothetical protein
MGVPEYHNFLHNTKTTKHAPVSYQAPDPLSVEDGVALGDEGSTAIASVPPQVVGLSPVGSSPGLHLHRRHHEHEGLTSLPENFFLFLLGNGE